MPSGAEKPAVDETAKIGSNRTREGRCFPLVALDLSILTWQQLWTALALLFGTGSLLSWGVMRLFQQHIRMGIILLISSAVLFTVFIVLIYNGFFE
jgi:hypothetical protein